MVRPVRFERMAFGVGVQRSIQLSYGRVCILYYISLFAICKAVIAGRSGRLTAKRPVLRRSGLLGRRFFLFALAVAVLLGEHTAAVILHIHTKLTRLVLSLAEARRKVAVQVLDAVFFGGLLADPAHQLMILVRAIRTLGFGTVASFAMSDTVLQKEEIRWRSRSRSGYPNSGRPPR